MISRREVVMRGLAILPRDSRLEVILRKRNGGDIDPDDPGTVFQARRKGEVRASADVGGGKLSRVTQTYQVFRLDQAVEPDEGDELDADGYTWQIEGPVRVSQLRGVFDCECTRNV